jgi:hypothetical protein
MVCLSDRRKSRAYIEEYFKQAIALDPLWAEPHSALGQQYFWGAAGGLRLNEMIPLARAEARKALELLPSEPLAHAVLGVITAVHDYDWKEADEQFKLARASVSVWPSVRHMYAGFYLSAFPLVHHSCPLFSGEGRRGVGMGEGGFPPDAFEPLGCGLLAGLLKQSGEKERAEKLLASLRGMSSLGTIIYHVVAWRSMPRSIGMNARLNSASQSRPAGPLPASLNLCARVRAGPSWRG